MYWLPFLPNLDQANGIQNGNIPEEKAIKVSFVK